MTTVIEKANTENKENTYPLLRFEVKETIVDFIKKYIVPASICSERLNDLYSLYTSFLEQTYPGVEVLKKRSFKEALIIVLRSEEFINRGFIVDSRPTNLGVLITGLGIQNYMNN